MNWLAIVMFMVDCCATFVAQAAYIFMKKGHIEVENSGLNGKKRKSPYKTKKWIMGLVCLIVGNGGHIVALPFLDLVVLSTGTALAIVINTILSIMYLNERFVMKYDLTAFSLIISGSIMICLLSDYSETTYTPEMINDLIWSFKTGLFIGICVLISVFSIFQYKWHSRKINQFNAQANRWLDQKLTTLNESENEKLQTLSDNLVSRSGLSKEDLCQKERPMRILN